MHESRDIPMSSFQAERRTDRRALIPRLANRTIVAHSKVMFLSTKACSHRVVLLVDTIGR